MEFDGTLMLILNCQVSLCPISFVVTFLSCNGSVLCDHILCRLWSNGQTRKGFMKCPLYCNRVEQWWNTNPPGKKKITWEICRENCWPTKGHQLTTMICNVYAIPWVELQIWRHSTSSDVLPTSLKSPMDGVPSCGCYTSAPWKIQRYCNNWHYPTQLKQHPTSSWCILIVSNAIKNHHLHVHKLHLPYPTFYLHFSKVFHTFNPSPTQNLGSRVNHGLNIKERYRPSLDMPNFCWTLAKEKSPTNVGCLVDVGLTS